jgi:hypothetical protein
MQGISLATKKLAMREFIQTGNAKDEKMYKAEKRKAKTLLQDILNPNAFQSDFIEKKAEDDVSNKKN